MPSNIITGASQVPFGFRPIQTSGRGVATPPGAVNPAAAFQADGAVMRKLQLAEQQHQFDQNLRLRLYQEQQQLFNQSVAGAAKTSALRQESMGLDPLLPRHAAKLNQIKLKQQAAQDSLLKSFTAAGTRGGRANVDGYLAAVDRTLMELENELLNDPEYMQLALAQRRKDNFQTQLKQLEAQGYSVDYSRANQAVRQYENVYSDVTGTAYFNDAMFDPQQYVFDAKAAQKNIGDYLNNAIGETEFENLISVSDQYPELGIEGLLTENVTVRNSLDDAVRIATNAIRGDSNAMRYMQSLGYDNPEEAVRAQLQSVLNNADMQRVSTYSNVTDVNTAARQKVEQAADIELEELKQRGRVTVEKLKATNRGKRGATGSGSGASTSFGFDTAKEPELADLAEYVNQNIPAEYEPTNQQVRSIQDYIDNNDLTATDLIFTTSPDGTLVASHQDADGELVTTQFGRTSPARGIGFTGFKTNENIGTGSNNVNIPQPGDRPEGRKNVAWYTNNPLNIKGSPSQHAVVAGVDEEGNNSVRHRVFSTIEEGLMAAVQDVRAKMTGDSSVVSPGTTLEGMYRVFATGDSDASIAQIAEILGVPATITMEELSAIRTPEQVTMALMSVESPEIYEAILNGETGAQSTGDSTVTTTTEPTQTTQGQVTEPATETPLDREMAPITKPTFLQALAISEGGAEDKQMNPIEYSDYVAGLGTEKRWQSRTVGRWAVPTRKHTLDLSEEDRQLLEEYKAQKTRINEMYEKGRVDAAKNEEGIMQYLAGQISVNDDIRLALMEQEVPDTYYKRAAREFADTLVRSSAQNDTVSEFNLGGVQGQVFITPEANYGVNVFDGDGEQETATFKNLDGLGAYLLTLNKKYMGDWAWDLFKEETVGRYNAQNEPVETDEAQTVRTINEKLKQRNQ